MLVSGLDAPPGYSEQDPEEWWEAAELVLAKLRERPASRLGSASPDRCTGWWRSTATIACCDPRSSGTTSAPARESAEIEHILGLQRLIGLTGNRALPGFTAPKLLWLRRHEPDTYAALARVMLPKDYIRLRLCGEHATDVSDASGTLLLNVAERRWSREVLDALEPTGAWLPPALESPAGARAHR